MMGGHSVASALSDPKRPPADDRLGAMKLRTFAQGYADVAKCKPWRGLEVYDALPHLDRAVAYRNKAVAGALSAIRIFQFGRRALARSTVSRMALATAGSFNTLK
jgi:hypothetical protein